MTDIWAAFCSSTRTILPAETYFDDTAAIMVLDDIDADLHACIAIWLTARVINLTADGIPIAESVDFHALKADMLKWESMGGPSTQAVLLREANAEADHPFPQILFSSHSASKCAEPWLVRSTDSSQQSDTSISTSDASA